MFRADRLTRYDSFDPRAIDVYFVRRGVLLFGAHDTASINKKIEQICMLRRCAADAVRLHCCTVCVPFDTFCGPRGSASPIANASVVFHRLRRHTNSRHCSQAAAAAKTAYCATTTTTTRRKFFRRTLSVQRTCEIVAVAVALIQLVIRVLPAGRG